MTGVALPRKALLLQVLAVLSSLVPHLGYLPVWLYLMVAFVLGWRWLVYTGHLSFPGRFAKLVAVVLACVGVYTLSGGRISLEGSSAFLISAGVLKLLELATKRDGVVAVFIALFIQASGFLFQQSILYSLQGVVTLVLACAAMVATQAATRTGLSSQVPVFGVTAKLLLTALPFMLIVYFLFPRLGPLWSVALQSDSAMTGLSERLQPGDISELSQSSEVAFRVTFEGDKPSRNELYWRAMTLDQHDGEGWDKSVLDGAELPMPSVTGESPYRYEVIQEATGQAYLFSLAGSVSRDTDIHLTATRLLRYDRPVYQRIRYDVTSSVAPIIGPAFDSALRTAPDLYLSLPPDVNPMVRDWARRQPSNAEQFAAAFSRYVRTQPFYYTLKPPRYSGDDIDQFLFSGRRGFCEHYASAMAFAARAAGIPSRVVAGYQGGEWHPDGYLTVRQYDAHAWVELWDGEHWFRVDPTAAVAPDRIEYGLQRALLEEDTFLEESPLSPHRYTDIGWVNSLRLQLDNINYQWSRWVLAYDGERQKGLLSRWFGIDVLVDGLYIIAGSIAGLFVVGALWQWWQQRPEKRTRLLLGWSELRRTAVKKGIKVEEGTAPLSLLAEIEITYPSLVAQCHTARCALIQVYKSEAEEMLERAEKNLARQLQLLNRQLRRVRPGAEATTSGNIQKRPV
ncbi:MAG: transglutaminaseTgpA domain-containing protein [Pseudomonadota bacterium]|nr:transglutaminaseTgpA domain-containing protein [Pseudomonadota bacterium]